MGVPEAVRAADLIPTLTGCLAAALGLGYVTQRLGLSPIVGYLLAGVVVGPFTPGFIANHQLAEQLADVGVILLMFGVGLNFHLDELVAVWRVVVPGALLQGAASTALGVGFAFAFGLGVAEAVVFGLALSIASTVVLTRVLSDHHDLHTPAGHLAVGWLVVQDLLAVVSLVLLPEIFGKEPAGPARLPLIVGLTAVKVGLLGAAVLFVGGRVIPSVLRRAAASRSRELFTLTVLVVALGVAVGSARLAGVSMALGAFLAGMVVGRSDFSVRAVTEVLPMRDAFAVLFFVSVGMLLDPAGLLSAPLLMSATLAVVLVGTPLAAFGVLLALGRPARVALPLAAALAQVGEFSFLIARLDLGRNDPADEDPQTGLVVASKNALVVASIVSISLNPLLYRLANRVADRLPRSRRPEGPVGPADDRPDPRHRAVIVGHGPVGRTLARLLRENDIEPTVIEMNVATVERLRAEGVRAVYGDAAHRDTLESAGVGQAATLILSASGLPAGAELIRAARELNPDVRVLARSAYLRERADLLAAGADAVFAGEGEVALAMNESVLTELGATPEQIDRERERLRADLFGPKEGPSAPHDGVAGPGKG